MHYGDEEQRAMNKLVVVIYKHDTPKKNVFDYDLCSIQECQYVPPVHVARFIKEYKSILKHDLEVVEAETWNMFTLTCTEENQFMVVKRVNVDKWSSCYKLH